MVSDVGMDSEEVRLNVIPNRYFKKVLFKGKLFAKPEIGSECEVNFKILRPNNCAVDSHYLDSTFNGVVKIWEGDTLMDRHLDNCLLLMNNGEISAFEFNIPGVCLDMHLEINLRSISEVLPFHLQDIRTKLDMAQHHKMLGSKLFESGRVHDAFHRFSKALKYLISVHSPEDDIISEYNSLYTNLHNNIAQCHLIRKNHIEVIQLSDLILKVDPNNVKALFRKGCSHLELQNYEDAKQLFDQALFLQPNNKAIISKLQMVATKQKELDNYYKAQMSKLFK